MFYSSKDFGDGMLMHSQLWVFASCISDKYQIVMNLKLVYILLVYDETIYINLAINAMFCLLSI